MRSFNRLGLLTSLLIAGTWGCGSEDGRNSPGGGQGGSGNNGQGAGTGHGANGSGGGIIIDPGTGGGGPEGGDTDNPATCAQAAENRTYIGCEFWPTITYNPLYDDFDFAVVLANGGTADADVTVTGPNGFSHSDTVPAGGLKAITLPWVSQLKGPEFSRENTSGGRATNSVRVNGGAYKVTSSVPVTAWQFNPLQFKKSGIADCAGSSFMTSDCFSVSNDASLLVPSTAMTGNYRVFGRSGEFAGIWGDAAGGFAVTAVEDGTKVKIQFGPNCSSEEMVNNNPAPSGLCIASGSGVSGAESNDIVDYTLDAGDVLQLLGHQATSNNYKNADVSGSVIAADKPVQVIAFNPITTMPDPTVGNADHIEELMLPAEVIGNKYIVAPPTNPNGVVKGGHIVRFYGNVDGTELSYPEGTPTGAPTSLDAGDVVEIGPLTQAFVVEGTEPFAVGSFMLGGALQGEESACSQVPIGHPCSGDPAFSMMVTPEQFRKQYTFLAPTDYDVNYADVLVPDGAEVTLNGSPLPGTPAAIGSSGWSIVRVPLSNDTGGVHKLSTTHESGVGLQVMGFGHATAYYYPGGLNLKIISEPPVIR